MERILVVDDDPQFLQIIKFSLEQAGLYVDTAANEYQALDSIASPNKYDLILLDVFLPNKENGLDVLSKLYNDVTLDLPPIVLMTSMPTQLFQQEAKVDMYLDMAKELISKTSNPKEIVDRVKQIITEQRDSS